MHDDQVIPIRFTSVFNRYALTAYRVCLSNRRLRAAAFQIIRVVLNHFFIPQFRRRRGVLSTPIVHVDHPLDEHVPYKPEHRRIYMSFIMLWISTLGYLYRSYGKKAEADIFLFFRLLEQTYLEAGWIYRRIMTTTRRPEPRLLDMKLKMVHALDPHLHCVPSLHVMVVCITWLYLDRLSEKPGRPDLRSLRNTVYRHSLMITESILFMKQHSVNCIPAGLYAVTGVMTELTDEKAKGFIDSLFTELEPELPKREELRLYMKDQYRGLLACGRESDGGDYKLVLLDYIRSIDDRSCHG